MLQARVLCSLKVSCQTLISKPLTTWNLLYFTFPASFCFFFFFSSNFHWLRSLRNHTSKGSMAQCSRATSLTVVTTALESGSRKYFSLWFYTAPHISKLHFFWALLKYLILRILWIFTFQFINTYTPYCSGLDSGRYHWGPYCPSFSHSLTQPVYLTTDHHHYHLP